MAVASDLLTDYLRRVRVWLAASAAGEPAPPSVVVGAVARSTARAEGWPDEVVAGLDALDGLDAPGAAPPCSAGLPAPPPELVRPELLGQVYEAVLDPGSRRRRGAFFTPPAVAARLVRLVADPAVGQRPDVEVGDPAVGGGAFLLAACRRLAPLGGAEGADPAELVGERVWGADIDPVALAVARLALGWWAWRESGRRCWPRDAGRRLVLADALTDDRAWPTRPAGRPWAVVGNPPFLGQLAGTTVRSPQEAEILRRRHGPAARGYVDGAALFLLAACRHGRPGDRVLLIQPESMLVSADGAAVRREVLARGRLAGLWLGGRGGFAAGVRVCAPLVELGPPHTRVGGAEVPTWRGPEVASAPPATVPPAELAAASTWGPVAAALRGVPRPQARAVTRARSGTVAESGTVADLATATAGFRDEYYGLVPLVAEWPGGAADHGPDGCRPDGGGPGDPLRRWAPLVTSGLIGPAVCHWGRRPARFARRTWRAPVVDLAALGAPTGPTVPGGLPPTRLAAWVAARLRPKLLLATQAPVLAAAADTTGCLVPSVPVVAVEPHDPGRLWHLLAAVGSPRASAWAAERFGGAGLGPAALKLAARQVLELPLPEDVEAWDRAAAAYRAAATSGADPAGWRARLVAAAGLANDAYRLTAGDAATLLAWWEARLPSWPVS